MAQDKSVQVNTLNIFLILVSLVLAYQFPFELFLLAYAILGPLHYVTEINWLEKKNFFVKERSQVWLLVLLTTVIAIPFALVMYVQTKEAAEANSIIMFFRNHSATMALMALFSAFAMVLTKDWRIVLLVFAGTFGLGLMFEGMFSYKILIAGLIPTIIHVYLFTILFMLYGALKERSNLGKASVVVMLIVPIIIWYIPVNVNGYRDLSKYYLESYNSSGFQGINYSIGYFLGITGEKISYAIFSEVGIKIQIFIAFAYTYHYLNWFSKTTVIGWHKVINKKRLILLLSIWIISVGFYFYNYYAGFLVLLFLSYLHVLMEFPLNWTSIKEIGKAVVAKR